MVLYKETLAVIGPYTQVTMATHTRPTQAAGAFHRVCTPPYHSPSQQHSVLFAPHHTTAHPHDAVFNPVCTPPYHSPLQQHSVLFATITTTAKHDDVWNLAIYAVLCAL